MKTIVAAIVFLGVCLGIAKAELLLSEPFNYPDGPLIEPAGSPWRTHSGNTPGQANVLANQLQLTSSETEDVNAALSGAPYDTTNNPSVTAVYARFKATFTALPSGLGSYFAHLRDTNIGFRCRIYALTNGVYELGKFRLGIGSTNSQSNSDGFVLWPSDLSTNVTYTVVSRLNLADGASTLWIDPTAETDPSITSTVNPGNPGPVATYAFRQNTGVGTMLIDDLRVGTAFGDVAGPNNPPSISPIASQSTSTNRPVGPIPFVIGDAETAATSLTLSKDSSNLALVPIENIVFGGSASNRTVTVTPAGGLQGTSTITIRASDGELQASVEFVLSVGLPSISNIGNQETAVNTATQPVGFVIGDAETPANALTLSATSSNPALVPDQNIFFEGNGSNRTVSIMPAADQSGLATITVSVSDGEISVSDTFVVTVYPTIGLVKSDDFNRPDGPVVDGSGLWLPYSGTFGQTQISGNQLKLSESQSEDIGTELPGAPFAPAGAYILYSSFTVNFTDRPSSTGGYFALFKDDGISNFRGRIFANTAEAAPGKFRLGIANSASSPSAQWPSDLSTGVTYTVVSKYNVGTGTSTLWVDPASENTAGVTATDNPSAITVWFYAFRQSPGIGDICIDDLKVGGSFASVFLPRPRLQIMRTGNSAEISWPASSEGFELQSSATFASWADVTETPAVVGDRKVITINGLAGNRFFRLEK